VSDLRRTLEDSPSVPRYVETVARRGYRFIAPVQEIEADTDPVARASEGQFVQTSNLEVLRSVFDGRLKLESLGTADIEAAIVQFGRAVQLDPAFAGGYVGLANAKFWKYELTRSRFQPDSALLAAATQDARQAVLLGPSFAEAHATLSYLLTASGRLDDARAAARRAVTLQPEAWAHHFRLGHATWGAERLRALARCLELYPAFGFAHFEMAMVHVARQAFDRARGVLREGTAIEARLGDGEHRFPANGLRWMLGAIALSQGDAATAVAECDRELASPGRSLYAREFSLAALNARGFALLTDGAVDRAAETFRQSIAVDDEQVRPHIGLARIARLRGRTDEWNQERAFAQGGVTHLQCGGRSIEGATLEAALHVLEDRESRAFATLSRLLEEPASSAGWSIPIDPLFFSLRQLADYESLSRTLASRASSDNTAS
jgi:tetratricopeptide (TPR) repeat protein